MKGETKNQYYHTLKELAEALPQPSFLRVHKSFIVNLDYVRLLDSNTR